MRNGECHRTLKGHLGVVSCIQFDESKVITGSDDATFKVEISWNFRNNFERFGTCEPELVLAQSVLEVLSMLYDSIARGL